MKNEEMFINLEIIESDILTEPLLKIRNIDKTIVDSHPTFSSFFTELINTYNRNDITVYAFTDLHQTCSDKARSLGDLYRICKYYYPNLKLRRLIYEMFKEERNLKTEDNLVGHYCNDINKRVYRLKGLCHTDWIFMDLNFQDEHGMILDDYVTYAKLYNTVTDGRFNNENKRSI